MTDCELCRAGDTGRIWSEDILTGKKNLHEAALFFKTTTTVVLEHINKHYVPTQSVGEYDDIPDCEHPEDFYLRELHRILKQLKDWTNYCVKSTDMSNRDIETMLKVIKETRDTLKVLGEFEGRINKQAQVQVNIAMINQRYDRIQDFLVREVCDECKIKVIDLMDELTKLPETTSIISEQ
jgi:hypothetical protein